ncbi:MAG TPA: hypothetical protein VFK05_33980 [Polyangiaceae bacterium]|nr:hypothetical protein [Polyangiaceae bacterium]
MKLHRRGAAYLSLSLLVACSSNSNQPTGSNGPDETQTSDVLYVDGITDEALDRLLDGTPKNDSRRVISVDSPDLTAPVPKDSPATFSFHPASEATHAPGPRLAPAKTALAKWQRAAHEFMQLLAPERIAYAHGTPYNGTAYYLVFSDKDGKHVLQVFTPHTSFTPENTDWGHLRDAPQPLTLAITSADFDADSIPADGGPFVGGKFSFRIE